MVGFPEGFSAPAGTELTIKTSNPRSPLIKVPIGRIIRPAPPTQPIQPAPFSLKPPTAQPVAH